MLIKLKKTKRKKIMMEIITFMLITLTCMSWFLVGCTYRYKERYKMYHKKLFHQEEQERPPSWGISREQNHNTWIASWWVAGSFSVLSIICAYFSDMILAIPVLCLMSFATAYLGYLFGRYQCDIAVKKQCKLCNVTFYTLN